MSELTGFKRMNFFTGFFTTAKDWDEGQRYHLEKRKLHNRRLHTPGILRGERNELAVEAIGGLNIRVNPGAALDGEGNEIYLGSSRELQIDPTKYELPQKVYVTVRFKEENANFVDNIEAPEYSGYTRVAEIADVRVQATEPDGQAVLELARIDLSADVGEIRPAADPADPKADEIDRRHVRWAGSVGLSERQLGADDVEEMVLKMRRTRRDFASLEMRFPVPSLPDVGYAAVSIELLARTGNLGLAQLAGVLEMLAGIEQDVGQEVGAAYGIIVSRAEYVAYQDAVAALLADLRAGRPHDALLTDQGNVAEKARELAEVVIRPPLADAGEDRVVGTRGDELVVALDASGSQAFGDHELKTYRWSKLNE